MEELTRRDKVELTIIGIVLTAVFFVPFVVLTF